MPIKSFLTEKLQVFIGEFVQICKEEIIVIFLWDLLDNRKKVNCFPTNFEASIILMINLSRKGKSIMRSHRQIFIMNIYSKILNKILSNLVQWYIEKVIH